MRSQVIHDKVPIQIRIPFSFVERKVTIDWKSINRINIQKILVNNDVKALEVLLEENIQTCIVF